MNRGPRADRVGAPRRNGPGGQRATASHGLARVLSKSGVCSRSQAEALVRAGRVSVAGRVCTDPERRTPLAAADIAIDGVPLAPPAPVYLALNKPRGLVTSRSDERGRDTVYACLADLDLPWLAPVGRLDRASEGLLLFSNDSAWAARVSAAGSGILKTYHVQLDRPPAPDLLDCLAAGVEDAGERLSAVSVAALRSGGFQVPNGFVITCSAFERFVREGSLGEDASQADALRGAGLTQASLRQALRPGVLTVADYDYTRPAMEMRSKAAVWDQAVVSEVHHGERFFDPAQGARLARIRAEAHRAASSELRASGARKHLRSGYLFDLVEHPRAELDGEPAGCLHVLTKVDFFTGLPHGHISVIAVTRAADSARFAEVNPSATVVALPGAGHLIHDEKAQRDAFLTHLTTFLSSLA